ncbi:MAG: GNAT family N-acetyltransferase [Firmicutes bacterium]|nr:GNAT family N-acetyltransferase [Bacillota bacterium]
MSITSFNESNTEACAAVIAAAFEQDPLYVHHLKSPTEKYLFSKFLIRKSLMLGEHSLVITLDEGVIQAAASYEVDSGHAFKRVLNQLRWPFLKEVLNMQRFMSPAAFRFFNQYMKFTTSVRPKERHYYLVFIGVHPEAQGKEYGTQLLNEIHGIVDSDVHSVGIGLDTENTANIAYYQRFGYALTGEKTLGDVTIYTLFRKKS